MGNYDDVVLVDGSLNKILSIPVDFYTKGNTVTFNMKVLNDTAYDVSDVKIATSSGFDGILQINSNDVTSNWDTTVSIGALSAGTNTAITLTIFISGGSPLDGLQMIPLYIQK